MKEAGKHLIVGHAGLDELCRRIAPMLNITLPNQATPQQQQFVANSAAQSAQQFDSTAANIMRVTHGQIFPTIAKIRASTTNTLVRQHADLANDTVLDLTHPPHSPAPPLPAPVPCDRAVSAGPARRPRAPERVARPVFTIPLRYRKRCVRKRGPVERALGFLPVRVTCRGRSPRPRPSRAGADPDGRRRGPPAARRPPC